MGLILLISALISTLHFLLIALFLLIVYCLVAVKTTRNKRYLPYKLISFIIATSIGYIMLAWFYFLKYVSTYNFPGPSPNLNLWSMGFNIVGLLIIGLYPNVVEILPNQKKIHIFAYTLAILVIIL